MPPKPEDTVLSVRVTPRSSQNKIQREPDGLIKVWLTAPPVEGEANAALCELLAKQLGVPKSRVHVVSGSTGRTKKVLVEGLPSTEIAVRFPTVPKP